MRGLENHIVMAGNVLPPPPYSQHMQTAIGTRAHPSALVGTHFRVNFRVWLSSPVDRSLHRDLSSRCPTLVWRSGDEDDN